jgi:glycosyltransferase involved in cell wall biosynthesis
MNCPVALFAYRRPHHLRKVVESLLANPEASDTDLVIFSDAAKSDEDQESVNAVRSCANAVSGFRKVTVVERDKNYGLSKSITDGVTALCEEYGRVAVVEDDVVVSPFFLSWINRALDKYESDDRVISVGCYVFPTVSDLPETYFLNITDCWGWAVWKRSWDVYEPDGTKLFDQLRQRCLTQRFNLDGAYPYMEMLQRQIAGRNDSWAVRWYATAVLSGGLTIYPGRSMTMNIGFDGTGTHCAGEHVYETQLAGRTIKIDEIPVRESEEARRAWSSYLRGVSKTTGTPQSYLAMVQRWAGRLFR